MNDDRCKDPSIRTLLGAYELGMLSDVARKAVEGHVLECDICFDDLYQTAPITYNTMTNRKKKSKAGRRWHIPTIAAAVFLLAFTTTFYFVQNDPDVKRSRYSEKTTIDIIGPRGSQRGDLVHFEWRSASVSPIYQILVFNEEGDPIWSCETSSTSRVVDLSQEKLFHPGETYYWKVVGNSEYGRTASVSQVYSFTIEGADHHL